jgi:two-component system sensor histidine kinase VicK
MVAKDGAFVFSNIRDVRVSYRFALSFALMGIIPLLLTIYLVVVLWLPDLGKWGQISTILSLGLLATILGFLLTRSMFKSILDTSLAAREIADGDLSKRIEVDGQGREISELAESFNEITSRLERKIAELEISEGKFRHLMENVPDLLYYLDTGGKITSVNDEVVSLLGYSKDEVLHHDFSDFVHEEDYEKYGPILRERRIDESRLAGSLRVRLRAKDGEYMIFEINSRGIHDEAGCHVGTEGIARDVTAKVAMEKAREEFLYMLTHDIKNPITAILFIVSMMRDGTISAEKFDQYYDKIENACSGVVRLVEDFLEYEKFEIGSINIVPAKVNMHRLLLEVASTYSSEASAKGKRIMLNDHNCDEPISMEVMVLEIDEQYVLRAVENLVTNAIKFAKTRIDIRCEDAGDSLIFSVSDDGPGIPEEEKEHIFNLFHTTGGVRTIKGIGVGLASVRKIVAAHNGRLAVESANGEGCSFTIELPKNPVTKTQAAVPSV